MTIQEQIRVDMVRAMKAKEEVRLSVLRGLLTMFMQELTATKRTPQDTLTDEEALVVIRRARKQREDASAQFRAGNRTDLAQKEDAEAIILSEYLPPQMPIETVERIVQEQMTLLGATDKSAMGKLMKSVMGEVKGQADGATVKNVIERVLASS